MPTFARHARDLVGAIPVTSLGVFPVQGAHTYGDGIGVARDGHTHQGQDIRGAAGTPIVAPLRAASRPTTRPTAPATTSCS